MPLPLPTNITGVSTAHLAHHNDIHGVVNNAARKPVVGDAILYVSSNGNDTNDGFAWGSAKLTIKAAIDALPASGGTVEFSSGVYAQADTTKGLWFWGVDGTRPAGWIKPKVLLLRGVPTLGPGLPTGGAGMAQILGGSGYPFKFMWDVVQARFENIYTDNSTVAMRMGVADDGTRWQSGADQVSAKAFYNCKFRCNNVAGNGPTIDIGSNCFWIWFEHCLVSANEQELVAADKRCAILIDSTASGGSGLIHVRDSNFAGGGGLRYKSGAVGGLRVFLENITTEASTTGAVPGSTQPALDLVKVGGDILGLCKVSNVEIADAAPGAAAPAVRVDPAIDPRVVVAENCGLGPGLEGPMTLIGGKPETGSSHRNGQIGFQGGRLLGRHDSARRMFGPTSVLYANLAPQDTSTWSAKVGSATVTTGKLAPNGTTQAAELSSTTGLQERQVYRANTSLVVGDYVMAGVWARVVDSEYPAALSLDIVGSGWAFDTTPIPAGQFSSPPYLSSKEWEWLSSIKRVGTVGGGSNEVIMGLRADTSKRMEYFAPVFYIIPVATPLDEVHELRVHASTWSDGAPVGHISTLRGQKLITHGGLGVGNSAAATTPGSVTKKMEVFDQTGASLGFIPIYSSIT